MLDTIVTPRLFFPDGLIFSYIPTHAGDFTAHDVDKTVDSMESIGP